MNGINIEDIRQSVESIIDYYEATYEATLDKGLAKDITINYITSLVNRLYAEKEKEMCFDACKLYN